MTVFCNYHNEEGTCTEEDFNDAKTGKNPSRMVRVTFDTFTQAVPFITLSQPQQDPASIADSEMFNKGE